MMMGPYQVSADVGAVPRRYGLDYGYHSQHLWLQASA